MHFLIPFSHAGHTAAEMLGGKALMLARLHQANFVVPDGYCLPVGAYHDFLAETGLAEFISMELQRKDFKQMRWEEVWDVSLRIRNLFVRTAWPTALKQALLEDLNQGPSTWDAVAVRSTAPGEDSARQSFAGLHDSCVMVRGAEAMLDAIRVVWSSLWSDGALIYRQELGLDPATSSMAVIIQQMVEGETSGIFFTRAPHDTSRMMVEAVWGLNQALVDGTLEPDRWQLDRANGNVVEKHEVSHSQALRSTRNGTELVPLAATQCSRSPLDESLCEELFRLGIKLEKMLKNPLDIEWTVRDQTLYLLQVRPITSGHQAEKVAAQPWYQNLHLSLSSLERLRDELEEEILPGMTRDAQMMAATDPAALDDNALAAEVCQRREILHKWLAVYTEKCIPMAHGIRLFGEFYNDTMRPEDPYAFIDLLRSNDLLAVERNRQLLAMACLVRNDADLLERLKQGAAIPATSELRTMADSFFDQFGRVDWIAQGAFDLPTWLVKLANETEGKGSSMACSETLESAFLLSRPQEESALATRLLSVARASYSLRDNDNLYLGKVRAEVLNAEQQIRERLQVNPSMVLQTAVSEVSDPDVLFSGRKITLAEDVDIPSVRQIARQMVGQPAGPGVDSGVARVLQGRFDLRDFQSGEVLVCDAIEPNMTFLVPLAVAIIERRGGMLIHGAIIAREYGIPCVTGIHGATQLIHTGDVVTVDGYLGIVTIDRLEG
jgi:pyruvate,water dikinase